MAAGVPLSKGTRRRLDVLFEGDERREAERVLVEECGDNLPFCQGLGPEQLERLRFAAIKESEGRMDLLRRAVELANRDWRDLLLSAGFGVDVTAHQRWEPWAETPEHQ